MSRSQIIEKLDTFLQNQPFTEECHVVYLMVELRKVLDHAYDRKNDFKLLRFYCDWTLHTEKSRSLEHIQPIIDAVYNSIKGQIENNSPTLLNKGPIVSFMYIEDLKAELADLLKKEGLPTELCTNDGHWLEFVKNIFAVLTDQPIVNPSKDVTLFTLLPAAPGCVLGRMNFAQPITSKEGLVHYYPFGNAY